MYQENPELVRLRAENSQLRAALNGGVHVEGAPAYGFATQAEAEAEGRKWLDEILERQGCARARLQTNPVGSDTAGTILWDGAHVHAGYFTVQSEAGATVLIPWKRAA